MMKIKITEWPNAEDWYQVKRRALGTEGKKEFKEPTETWKKNLLKARHSPIRRMMFSFDLEIPYWVSVHLCRHIHAQPYIQSQRNDRQIAYDRNAARQDELVYMIWDMNAEEFITICNKRMCYKASEETRMVIEEMARQAIEKCPEFIDELVPMCEREKGCNEMRGCGRYENRKRT